MSLIPSESYSFPDNFSRTIGRARVFNEMKSTRAVKPQPRRPRPADEPAPANPETASLLLSASEDIFSPPVSKNRNSRLTNNKPFGPVRIKKAVAVDLAPKPEVATAFPVINSPAGASKSFVKAASPVRKNRKWIRLLLSELAGMAVLMGSGILVLSHRLTDPAMVLSLNAITIVAASFVAIVPILFFAIAPTLPRCGR